MSGLVLHVVALGCQFFSISGLTCFRVEEAKVHRGDVALRTLPQVNVALRRLLQIIVVLNYHRCLLFLDKKALYQSYINKSAVLRNSIKQGLQLNNVAPLLRHKILCMPNPEVCSTAWRSGTKVATTISSYARKPPGIS